MCPFYHGNCYVYNRDRGSCNVTHHRNCYTVFRLSLFALFKILPLFVPLYLSQDTISMTFTNILPIFQMKHFQTVLSEGLHHCRFSSQLLTLPVATFWSTIPSSYLAPQTFLTFLPRTDLGTFVPLFTLFFTNLFVPVLL